MKRKSIISIGVAFLLSLFLLLVVKPQPSEAESTMNYIISPGASAVVTSSATQSTTLSIDGLSFDYVKYDDDGDVVSSQQEDNSAVITVASTNRVIVTNTSTTGNVTLETTSRPLNMSYSAAPALIRRTLAPGQSMTAVNIGSSSELIRAGGDNNYENFDENGLLISYDEDGHSGTRGVPAGHSTALTNSSSVSYVVTGPYEKFTFADRITPVLFSKVLQPGETLEATNRTLANFTLYFHYDGSAVIEYALFDEDGDLNTYGSSSAYYRFVSSHERWVMTNKDDESMVVTGPYDGFDVSYRTEPALRSQTLQNGQSLRIDNVGDKAYRLDFDGPYDYAEYNAEGEEEGYGRNVATSSNSIAEGNHIVVTKSGAGTVEVTGPYEAFEFTASASPALYTRTLAPGESLEAANLTTGTTGIRLDGVYDYALYDNPGGIRSYEPDESVSELTVLEGDRAAFTNIASYAQSIYAPYNAFFFQTRTNPVTFRRELTPGQTIVADNTTSRSFTIDVSGQNHYAIYDTGNEVSEFGRPITEDSYTIEDTETLVLTNSGIGNIVAKGPYDAFTVSDRDDPALSKTYWPQGTSLSLGNTGPNLFDIDLEGMYDQASYMADGSLRSIDRMGDSSSLPLHDGERITLTSDSSTPLQVIVPFDVTAVQSSETPALTIKALEPGANVQFINHTGASESIELTGRHDLMEYTASGSPDYYSRDRNFTTYSIGAGLRAAVENSDTLPIEAYGAYEIFTVSDRSDPVTFKRTLSPGGSLDIVNTAGKSFPVYPDGLYDYALYDDSGDAADEDREYPAGTRSILDGDRLAMTNADVSAITVEGPFDAFAISNRTNSALFEYPLAPHESVEAIYTGADRGDVHMTGMYDYELFAGDDSVEEYRRGESFTSSEAVDAGQRIAVENSDASNIVVYGAYDLFDVTSRPVPVTFRKTLTPGQSMEAVNNAPRQFSLYSDGLYDYAQFDETGAFDQLDHDVLTPSKIMLSGRRIAITNTDEQTMTVEGAYDVFTVTDRENPALLVNTLQPGAAVELTNTSVSAAQVKMTGTYDVAVYDATGALDDYTHHASSLSGKTVQPGQRIALQGSDTETIEAYGYYDWFEAQPRSEPVTFRRTLTTGQTVEMHLATEGQLSLYFEGNYDYASYAGNGRVQSFQTWDLDGYHVLMEGDKLVVSPSEAQSVTVEGSYDGIAVTDRSARAVTVVTLQQGESYSFRNISPSSFLAQTDGVYDYEMYDLSGNLIDSDQDVVSFSRSVASTNRLVVTNPDTEPFTLSVPTDAIQETSGDDEDSFTRTLEIGDSINAVNTTSATQTLTASGTYDLAIYNAAGAPYSFARESSGTQIAVPAGYRAVLTGRQSGAGAIISGSLTEFQVNDQTDPALTVVHPGQGSTISIDNISGSSWSLSADGTADWTKYEASGVVADYEHEDERASYPLAPAQRFVVTQPQADGLALWGPFEAIETEPVDHAALDQAEVDEGETTKATNVTETSHTLKVAGSFDYSINEGAEQGGQSPLSVPAGSAAFIRNTDSADFDIYAPYGFFEFEDTNGGSTGGTISGSAAAAEIAKLDPANYDPQSIDADPIDTATGAQMINRTMLTAYGAVPIPFQVQYNSLLTGDGALGPNWTHNFEIRLEASGDGSTAKVYWNAFRGNTFGRDASGNFSSPDEATRLDELVDNPDGTYVLSRNDGTVYHFAADGTLASMEDKTGLKLMFSYSGGRLTTVYDPLTIASLSFSYDTAGRLSTVSDQSNRHVSMTYDTAGRLFHLTDPMGRTTIYEYDDEDRVQSASVSGLQLFENEFDDEGRVIAQHDAIAGSDPTEFDYEEANGQLVTTITDRNGDVQKRTHDANYHLLSVEDGLGRTTSFAYDNDGNRTTITNALDQTTTYTYDSRGNVTEVEDYNGNTMEMTYDADNNLLTVTGPDDNTLTYTYDTANRLLTATDPADGTTVYTYNATGLLATATDPLEGETIYTYTANRLTKTENAESETMTFGYDTAGRRTSQTDVNGNRTSVFYNANDELVTVTDALNHGLFFTYDNQGFQDSVTDARNYTTTFDYDGNGNLTEMTDALQHTTAFGYDGEGRLTSVTDPLNRSMMYSYDAAGNLLTETNGEDETVRYEYDDLNRLTDAYDPSNVHIYAADYDAAGNLSSETDALDETRTYLYDDLNRLTQVIDPLERSTGFGYDDLNRLTTVTDPLEGESSRGFDALSQITSVTDPNENETGYTYDLVGRLTAETDPLNISHTYHYNTLGQLDQETNGRLQSTFYTHDRTGRIDGYTDGVGSVLYFFDANGNLTSERESSGRTLTREFDALNQVKSYTDEYGRKIQYAYNAAGELMTLTYPDNKTVTYTYDDAGRMATVTDWDNRVTTYGYDANGRLATTTRSDGSIETRTYDANGQLLGISDKRADDSVIYEAGYTYDAVGNVLNETADDLITVTSSVYGTDTAFGLNGPGLSPDGGLALDGPGLSPDNGTAYPDDATMTYTSDNRLATYNGSTVVYDADGNMTTGPLQDSMQTYTYDARNRLTSAGGVSYGYNSDNMRTSMTANGVTTRYVIDPQAILSQVLMETNASGQGTAWYVYGLGLIGREDASGDYLTYHYDRRGSTMAMTDESGDVTDTYRYGVYGEELEHTGETDQPFRYNGRDGVMTDPNGLYQMRARYYNPDIKRFVNRDVVTGSIDAGQTLNRFAYANGNPVSFIDPFGLSRDGDALWLQGGDFLIDVVPWVGTVKGFQQAFTGMNYVTGEQLSVTDRWSEGIGSALSLIPIPGLKYAGKYGTEGVVEAGRGLERLFGAVTKGAGEIQTGGRNNLSVDEYFRREAEADKIYNSIRASSTDVLEIANNTGIKESRVQRIKDHVFFNEHIKSSGYGRFHSDYEIAQAWTRLQQGIYNKTDIDLLMHELFESRFEGIFKTNYETAHDAAVRSGRPWEID